MEKGRTGSSAAAERVASVRRNGATRTAHQTRPTDAVRVLLVDEGPEFAAEAISLFRELESAELVGVATSADLAERYVVRLQPDLVLLSLTLPDASGPEVAGTIRRLGQAPVAVLALEETEACRAAVLRAGAFELVAKSELMARLPTVLRGFPRRRRRVPGGRRP